MPNPGSADAKRLGCTCSPLDNHYGDGVVVDTAEGAELLPDVFSVASDCPIHIDMRNVEDASIKQLEEGDLRIDGDTPVGDESTGTSAGDPA